MSAQRLDEYIAINIAQVSYNIRYSDIKQENQHVLTFDDIHTFPSPRLFHYRIWCFVPKLHSMVQGSSSTVTILAVWVFKLS